MLAASVETAPVCRLIITETRAPELKPHGVTRRWTHDQVLGTSLELSGHRLSILEECDREAVQIGSLALPVAGVPFEADMVALSVLGEDESTCTDDPGRRLRRLHGLAVEHVEQLEEIEDCWPRLIAPKYDREFDPGRRWW